MLKEWFKFQLPIIGDTSLVYNIPRTINFEIFLKNLPERIKKELYEENRLKIFVLLE